MVQKVFQQPVQNGWIEIHVLDEKKGEYEYVFPNRYSIKQIASKIEADVQEDVGKYKTIHIYAKGEKVTVNSDEMDKDSISLKLYEVIN